MSAAGVCASRFRVVRVVAVPDALAVRVLAVAERAIVAVPVVARDRDVVVVPIVPAVVPIVIPPMVVVAVPVIVLISDCGRWRRGLGEAL
jgi:hypothetical protein